MTVIYGTCYANERMEDEKMEMAPKIRVDHNWYDGQRAATKMKEVEDVKKDTGYEVGYNGKTDGSAADKLKRACGGNVESDDRQELALGGAAKIRKDYPGI